MLFSSILVHASLAHPLVQPIRVWIDCDPALGMLFRDADDGFAIVQALHSPDWEIAGISIVRGNSEVADGLRIARRVVDTCGQTHRRKVPPIYAGQTSAARSSAADALQTALSRKLTYISLGPLGNLAEFLRNKPAEAKNIERIIFLGGEWPEATFRAGGWNPYRFTDANFPKDPAAAQVVLASGIPIMFVPIDVARCIGLSANDMRMLRKSTECPAYVVRQASGWFFNWRFFFGVREAPVFDALVLLAVTDPQNVETVAANCHIVNQETTPRLLLSNSGSKTNPPKIIAVTSVSPAARSTWMERLTGP